MGYGCVKSVGRPIRREDILKLILKEPSTLVASVEKVSCIVRISRHRASKEFNAVPY